MYRQFTPPLLSQWGHVAAVVVSQTMPNGRSADTSFLRPVRNRLGEPNGQADYA